MAPFLLRAERLTKVYPDGTVALSGVDLEVRPGEILGLLGENGAGKTTLTKILSGLLPPTSGRLLTPAGPVRFHSPKDALRRGIGMVHQHFALVGPFTALENVALGLRGISLPALRERLEALIAETGLHVPLDVPVEQLAVGERQRVEILKVLARHVNLLILDEPTSVLTPVETAELFKFLRALREKGKAVVFITHKLKEALAITDRIVVLRRGRVAGEVETGRTSAAELARLMVGAEAGGRGSSVELAPETPAAAREERAAAEPALVVEDLRVRADTGELAVRGLSFALYPGEILGIAGVEGNGQTELVEALCGLRPIESGRVFLLGRPVAGRSPLELYRLGLAHIPEDRWKHGLILSFTVMENAIFGLQRERAFRGPGGLLRRRAALAHAARLVRDFQIQAAGLHAPAKSLSGGNQQKLIVGRELAKDPKVIVAAQPTRGLDIGAAQFIRELLLKLREEGRAILLVSADLDEVLALADRVAFMYEGAFVGVARPAELTPEAIGLLMGGIKAGAR